MFKRNEVTMIDHTDGLKNIIKSSPDLIFVTGQEQELVEIVKKKKLPKFKQIKKILLPIGMATDLYVEKLREAMAEKKDKVGNKYAKFFAIWKLPHEQAGIVILASDEDEFIAISEEVKSLVMKEDVIVPKDFLKNMQEKNLGLL